MADPGPTRGRNALKSEPISILCVEACRVDNYCDDRGDNSACEDSLPHFALPVEATHDRFS